MKEQTIIERITRCAESLGWHVQTSRDKERNITFFTFSQFTPKGQDFAFEVEMKGAEISSLVQSMSNYYEGFDVDAEAYLWLDSNGHGKNGAPYRMREVLEDMEAAERMVEQLFDAIEIIKNEIEQ
jgi:hypothetical protein